MHFPTPHGSTTFYFLNNKTFKIVIFFQVRDEETAEIVQPSPIRVVLSNVPFEMDETEVRVRTCVYEDDKKGPRSEQQYSHSFSSQ